MNCFRVRVIPALSEPPRRPTRAPQQNALSRRGLPLNALRMVNPEPRPHDLGQRRGFLVLSKPHGRPSRTDRIIIRFTEGVASVMRISN